MWGLDQFFPAAAQLFKWLALSKQLEINRDLQTRQEELDAWVKHKRKEIQRLRGSTSTDNHLLADQLHSEIQRRLNQFSAQVSTRDRLAKWDNNTNEGG